MLSFSYTPIESTTFQTPICQQILIQLKCAARKLHKMGVIIWWFLFCNSFLEERIKRFFSFCCLLHSFFLPLLCPFLRCCLLSLCTTMNSDSLRILSVNISYAILISISLLSFCDETFPVRFSFSRCARIIKKLITSSKTIGFWFSNVAFYVVHQNEINYLFLISKIVWNPLKLG